MATRIVRIALSALLALGVVGGGTASAVTRSRSTARGRTAGMLGFMFWAAERPATRGVTTQPPNSCEGGMGVGATTLTVPVPMPALRQQ